MIVVGVILLLIAIPVAAVRYFRDAWQKIGSVPNRASYIIWLSFETIAAVAVAALFMYAVIGRR